MTNMTVREMIEALEAIAKEHGDDVEVVNTWKYNSENPHDSSVKEVYFLLGDKNRKCAMIH